MADNQARLAEVEAEIEEARARRTEIESTLADLRSEYGRLEEASGVNISNLPTAEVREAVTLSTRAAIEGPAIRQTIRVLEKRLEHSSAQYGELFRRRDRLLTNLAGERVGKTLTASPTLSKTMAMFEEVGAMWGNARLEHVQHPLAQKLAKARQALKEVIDEAAQTTG